VIASFEVWVQTVFDHPPDGPQWFWAPDFDSLWNSLELTDVVQISYLTRLFRNSEAIRPYSLPQVAQAIWFLIGDASPAQPTYALVQPQVALSERIACIEAMTKFFSDFVAPAAPGPLDTETDSFHIACYMWWDIFPTWGGPQAGEPEIHQACLKVMSDVLALPADLCRLSALHGLNHWHLHYPRFVEQTIDDFLRCDSNLAPRIREYAAGARNGLCQ
jgi:hypothetical protein